MELSGTGKSITVQALCPGYTLSEFHDRIKMDRSRIPSSLWMTADFVVRESLAGFDRGQVFVIPGWRYRALVWTLFSRDFKAQFKQSILARPTLRLDLVKDLRRGTSRGPRGPLSG